MDGEHLDEIDRRILRLLQEDARNNTNAAISEAVGVSPSTVGNRIARLEDEGIVRGYHPNIDYEQAAFPLWVLFVCTAPIPDRGRLVRELLDLPGVVNVRELMTGQHNLHVEVVGRDNGAITELAVTINELGIDVNEEVLVKGEYPRPANVFKLHGHTDG